MCTTDSDMFVRADGPLIGTCEAFYDDSDPRNVGWSYRYTDAAGVNHSDELIGAEDATLETIARAVARVLPSGAFAIAVTPDAGSDRRRYRGRVVDGVLVAGRAL